MPSKSKATASRLPRSVRLAARIALLVYLGYLVIANAWLWSPYASRTINRVPERFQLEWQRVVTLWPGHLLVQDLVASGHARHVRWRGQAEFASGRIALLPLVWRELRFPDVVLIDVQIGADQVEEFIPPRERSAKAWTVSMPSIRSSSVSEAHWNNLYLSGSGEVAFGFRKELRSGPMEILPSRLTMRDAQLRRGESELLHAADVEFDMSMARHTPSEHPGRAKLALVDAALQIKGGVSLPRQTRDRAEQMQISLQRHAGSIEVDLALRDAELQSGGRVVMQVPLVLGRAGSAPRDAVLDLVAEVEEQLLLRVTLPAQPGSRESLDLELRVAQRSLPLDGWRALLDHTAGHVDLVWQFDSLRWLSDAMVGKPWLDFDGAGELEAALRIDAGRLVAGSRFEARDMQATARVLDNRISGSGHAVGEIAAEDPATADAGARVNLLLERFTIASEADHAQTIVEGSDLALELRASADLSRFQETLRARLRFDEARVSDLTLYNHYLPRRDLRFTGGHGTLSGDMNLDANGRVASGLLALRAVGASMHVGRVDISGDVTVDTRLSRAELDAQRLDLDDSRIGLSKVSYRDSLGRTQQDWWARITLPKAQATWGRPMAIDAEATLEMRDIGLLMTLFRQKKSLPKWVARVIDAGEAKVDTRLQVRGKSVVLDRLEAENDRFDLSARLKLADSKANGDLLLSWGVLSLGIELDESERDYRLIGARKWYEGRPHLLDEP